MWSELRLEMRIETRRLKWLAVLGLLFWKALGLVILGSATGTAAYFGTGWWSPLEDASVSEVAIFILWPYSDLESWTRPDRFISPWVSIAAMTVLLTPFTFFLMPESLRRARVRRLHIVRIACYSIALMPLMIGVWSLLKCLNTIYLEMDWNPPWLLQLPFRGNASMGVGGISLVWTVVTLVIFWRTAVRCYLRLPHPEGVAVAMVSVAVLLAAVIVVLTNGHSLFW